MLDTTTITMGPMERAAKHDLLALAVAYGRDSGLALSTISDKAAGDPALIPGIVKARDTSFTLRKYDRSVQWFADNWPRGLKWPKGVQRPPRSKQAAA